MRISHQIALSFIGVLIIVGAGYFLFMRPRGLEIAAQKEAVVQRQEELRELRKVALQIRDVEQEINRLKEALKFFESKLPQQKEVDVILRKMWVIAEESGLKTGRVMALKAKNTGRYNVQPIEISLDGSFDGFYKFLLALERLPRIIKVQAIELQKADTKKKEQQSPDNRIQASILMDMFFEK